MAKPPHVFQSRDELVTNLRSDRTRSVAEKFFSEKLFSIDSVVREGVSGNTFRAFQDLPERPSVVFRDWATNYIKSTLHELQKISNDKSYAAYVDTSSRDLCKRWRATMKGDEIGYGRGSKLFNLVLKKLACYSALDVGFRRRFIELQHVPLDSYTIVGLRRLIGTPSIPPNATMKFIKKPSDYRLLQQYISSVAKEAGVPAIYYDILAWDMAH